MEAEPSLARVFDPDHGFTQLAGHRGNYKWLAISKDVYEEGKTRIRKECKRREIGLLIVSGKERFSVQEKLKHRRDGDFLSQYPKAEQEWEYG